MKKFLTIALIFITNIVFADVGMIVNKFKPYFPEIKAENISTSQLDGYYEVVLTNPSIDVLYISMDGRYVLQGAVTDLELMTNISEGWRQFKLNEGEFSFTVSQGSGIN